MARAWRGRRRSRRPEVEKSRLEADFSKRKFGGGSAELKIPKPQNPKIPQNPQNPKNLPEGSRPKVRISKRKRAGGSMSLEESSWGPAPTPKISKRRRFWRSQPPEAKIDPEGSGRRSENCWQIGSAESAPGIDRRGPAPNRRNRPKRPKSTPIDQNWTGTH